MLAEYNNQNCYQNMLTVNSAKLMRKGEEDDKGLGDGSVHPVLHNLETEGEFKKK